MTDDLPTQTISFSSLVTKNIDLSTWNDARFHAITPPISLKAGELTRLILEEFPALYPIHEVHALNDLDDSNVDIIGTLYERGPSDLDAPSADEVKQYATTTSVPDILKFVEKEKFDELIEDIRGLQARLIVLHGQAMSVDRGQSLVAGLLPGKIEDLLKPSRNNTVQSSDARPRPDHDQFNHRCGSEAQVEPGVTLNSISESWSTLKEIGESLQKSVLQYSTANGEVHEEFNKLHLDLMKKEYTARDMFYDATVKCRRQQYKGFNECIKAVDAERYLKVITFLQAKKDIELSLGVTYNGQGLYWVPRHELQIKTQDTTNQHATLNVRALVSNDTVYEYSTQGANFVYPVFSNIIATQSLRPWYIKPQIKSIVLLPNDKDNGEDPWEIFPQPLYDLTMPTDEQNLISSVNSMTRNRRNGPPPRPPPTNPPVNVTIKGWDTLFSENFTSKLSTDQFGLHSQRVGFSIPPPPSPPPPPPPNQSAESQDTRAVKPPPRPANLAPQPPPPNRPGDVVHPDPRFMQAQSRPPPGPPPAQRPPFNMGQVPMGPPQGFAGPPQHRPVSPLPQTYTMPTSQNQGLPPFSINVDNLSAFQGPPGRPSERDGNGENYKRISRPGEVPAIQKQRDSSPGPVLLERRQSSASGGWDRLKEVVDDNDIATPRTLTRENSELQAGKDEKADENPDKPAEDELYDFDAELEEEDDYTPAEFSEETNAECGAVKPQPLTSQFRANYPFTIPSTIKHPSIGERTAYLPTPSLSAHILAKLDLPIVSFKRRCTPKDRRICNIVYTLKNTSPFPIPAGNVDISVDGVRFQDCRITSWAPSGTPEICLGGDPAITVGYGDRRIQEVYPRTTSGKILAPKDVRPKITKRRFLCQREIFLKNLHPDMVTIDVWDQIPVIDTAGMISSEDTKIDGTYGAEVRILSPRNLKEGRKVTAGAPLSIGKDQNWGEAIAEQLEEGAVKWEVRLRSKKGVKLVLEWVVSIPLAGWTKMGNGKEEIEGVVLENVKPLEMRSAIGESCSFAEVGRGEGETVAEWKDGPQVYQHGAKF